MILSELPLIYIDKDFQLSAVLYHPPVGVGRVKCDQSNANEMSVSGTTTINNKIIQELTHVFLKVVERIFAVCSCRSH